jgi:hypothetical protein
MGYVNIFHRLFSDAASVSRYIASNGGEICEEWIWKGLEKKNGHVLIELHFSRGTEKTLKERRSVYPVPNIPT